MTLEQEIVKALKSGCYVSFTPNMPRPGMVRVATYRKGKVGAMNYHATADKVETLADAMRHCNEEHRN
jgi:hypothetical protein